MTLKEDGPFLHPTDSTTSPISRTAERNEGPLSVLPTSCLRAFRRRYVTKALLVPPRLGSRYRAIPLSGLRGYLGTAEIPLARPTSADPVQEIRAQRLNSKVKNEATEVPLTPSNPTSSFNTHSAKGCTNEAAQGDGEGTGSLPYHGWAALTSSLHVSRRRNGCTPRERSRRSLFGILTGLGAQPGHNHAHASLDRLLICSPFTSKRSRPISVCLGWHRSASGLIRPSRNTCSPVKKIPNPIPRIFAGRRHNAQNGDPGTVPAPRPVLSDRGIVS